MVNIFKKFFNLIAGTPTLDKYMMPGSSHRFFDSTRQFSHSSDGFHAF